MCAQARELAGRERTLSDREELIAVANTYLQHGLLEHRPELVLFADDCVRFEMGFETGRSAEQLRELLLRDAYKANKAMGNFRWVVEDPYVDVRYSLEAHGVSELMEVAARFKIVDGRIAHIDILFHAGALQQIAVETIESLRTD